MKCDNCIHKEVCKLPVHLDTSIQLGLQYKVECSHFIHHQAFDRMKEKIKNQREQLRQMNMQASGKRQKAYKSGFEDGKHFLLMSIERVFNEMVKEILNG